MLIEWCEACERQPADLYRDAAGDLRVRLAQGAEMTVAALEVREIIETTDQERARLEADGVWGGGSNDEETDTLHGFAPRVVGSGGWRWLDII